MNAEANPSKINNQMNENISSSSITLGGLLKQLKNQGNNDGKSSTSRTSKNLDSKKLQRFRELYSNLESGTLTSEKFKTQVLEEMKVSSQFDKILNDPHRSYKEIVKTLEIAKTNNSSELFDAKQGKTVISSTALTTVPSASRTDINMKELNNQIKAYSQGFSNKSDFLGYLREKNIPINTELERNLREHEETKSVPFFKIGKCIYTAISEEDKTNSLTGSPNKKNPNSYRFVNKQNFGKGSAETKEKMKQETLKKELDKLGNGVYITHKRKMDPKVVDNGELTTWEPDYSGESRNSKTLSHLQHQDIFGWNNASDDAAVVRKGQIVQRAALNSGDIIKWQD